jgi:hypothetical protein
MSSWTADLALDALLADFRPPPVPRGLAGRVAAAALALAQEPASPRVSPAPRHDRRGRWLRRPLLVGGAALGLAFTGALAASFAGVELPRTVAAVLEKLPLVGKAAPEPAPSPQPASRRSSQAAPTPPAPIAETPAMEAPPVLPLRIERRVERIERAQEIVAERRAAGLPTPRADRMERMLERRRAAGLPTPRADRVERLLEQRRAARAAGTAVPLPPDAPVETPRERLRRWIDEQRARRDAAAPPTPPAARETQQAPPPRVEPVATTPAPDQASPASGTQLRDAPSADQRRAWLRQQQILQQQRLERLRRAQDRRATTIRRAPTQRVILRPTSRR